MQRSDIQTMVNSNLLDGRTMDDTLFGTLLNVAKNKVEMARPWVVLRNEDSSQSIPSGTVYTTTFTLPTRFASPYPVKRSNGESTALVLVSGTDVQILKEIPWAQRLEYQQTYGYFAIDYANGVYCVTGPTPKTYTAYWSYIKFSASLDADADVWVFDTRMGQNIGGSLLAYMVAAMEKARDYDEVNMANIALYAPEAAAMVSALNMWNSNLERAMHGV